MRKVIQMTATYIPEGEGCGSGMFYTALCDDGTMWQGDGCWSNKWEQLPPIGESNSHIPQDSI